MKTFRNFVAVCTAILLIFTASYFVTHQKKTADRRFHAIVFDMDGTIIDTDHIWKTANGPILDSHAPHLTQEEKNAIIATFSDLTIYEIWKLIGENCSIALSPEEIINENIHHLHTLYEKNGISFIQHFDTFHKKALSCDLKTAIASNSQQHTIDVIVKKVPLDNYFGQHIYNADHVNKVYKPQPDIYLHAAKMLNVAPCHCIAIEDSASGIKAAKAAGMYCIGINTGKNRNALAQADEIVDCYQHINLEKLLNLSRS